MSSEGEGVLGHISGCDVVCFASDSRVKQWRKEIVMNKFGKDRSKLEEQKCFQQR